MDGKVIKHKLLLIISMLMLVTCEKSGVIDLSDDVNADQFIEQKAAVKPVDPPIGMISWWTGDGNADDLINNNHGVLMNGTSFDTGLIDQAFYFDGMNDFVKILRAPNLDVGNQVTIEFWMKAAENNDMFSCCQGLVATDFYDIEIAGGMNFFVHTIDADWFAETKNANGGQGPVLSADKWHHVAGTYDGEKLQLYVDGLRSGLPLYHSGRIMQMLESSFLTIGSEDGRTTCPFCIGTRYFHGLIDEISLYNRALDPNEILAIFNAGDKGKDKTKLLSRSFPELAFVATGPMIEIVDLNKLEIIGSLNTPAIGVDLVPSQKLGYSVHTSGKVTKFDIKTRAEIVSVILPDGLSPNDIVISPDGSTAFLSLFSNRSIAVLNTEDLSLKKIFPLSDNDGPNGIELSSDGLFLFVANQFSGRVYVLDTKKWEIVKIIETGSQGVNELALSQNGQYLLATAYNNWEVYVIDAKALLIRKIIALPHSPVGIDIPANGSKAYIVGGNMLSVIDLKTLRIDQTVYIPGVGRRIGINTNNSIAISTGFNTNKIILIDLKKFMIAKTLVTTGMNPYRMDFIPGS